MIIPLGGAEVDDLTAAMDETTEGIDRQQHERNFIKYKASLVDPGTDLASMDTFFYLMLKVYKEQILGGWAPHTAMRTVYMQYQGKSIIQLKQVQIYQLFWLYFLSIGFDPHVWMKHVEIEGCPFKPIPEFS